MDFSHQHPSLFIILLLLGIFISIKLLLEFVMSLTFPWVYKVRPDILNFLNNNFCKLKESSWDDSYYLSLGFARSSLDNIRFISEINFGVLLNKYEISYEKTGKIKQIYKFSKLHKIIDDKFKELKIKQHD